MTADTPDPRPVSPPSELTAEGRLRADVAAHRYLAYRASDVEVLLALLDAARAVPEPSGLDVERLAEAWGNVMDGRHIPGHVTRIWPDMTTAEDWQNIAEEYAALSTSEPPAEKESNV